MAKSHYDAPIFESGNFMLSPIPNTTDVSATLYVDGWVLNHDEVEVLNREIGKALAAHRNSGSIFASGNFEMDFTGEDRILICISMDMWSISKEEFVNLHESITSWLNK